MLILSNCGLAVRCMQRCLLALSMAFMFPIFSASAQAQNTTNADTPAVQVAIEGFRSANFGMTVDEVRAAIKSDFALSGDDVVAGENAAERTGVLMIRSDKVLADGGPAQVSYVFGYESKKLIQVGVLWDGQTVEEAKLLANGEVLSAHFRTAGYAPDTIKQGLVLDNGILLFRGEDAEGRATVLLLQGVYTQAEGQGKTLTPTGLALLYAVDADKPDVFRIQAGQF